MRNDHPRSIKLPTLRQERVAQIQAWRWTDLEVVVEQVDDPHNVGAILRTCDAVGVKNVHLVYAQTNPPRLKELRHSAASAVKWLELKRWNDAQACIDDIKKRGLELRVTALSEQGSAQWDMDWKKPSAIVVCNEALGASKMFLDQADAIVTIPMRGFVQSLNVSVATAMVLGEALRQRTVPHPAD